MALVRSILIDALIEIGAQAPGENVEAAIIQFALRRFQHQIDSWNADQLALHTLRRETFVLTSGTNTVTIGEDGTPTITAPRPTFFTAVNYVVPGSSPAVETPIGEMDDDSYAAQSIKTLSSSLPTQYYYFDTVPNGTLFFWPTVSQDVTIALYYEQNMTAPATLLTDMIGPPGYQDAFMYQLALRLCLPLGRAIPDGLPELAREAYAKMKRPNTAPGLLGVDAALVPSYGGYNVINDSTTGYNR